MSSDDKIIRIRPQKRGSVRKIIVSMIVLLTVCGTAMLVLFGKNLNLDALQRLVRYWNIGDQKSTGIFEFDAHNSNCYANYSGGLAVASVGGLSTYQSDGQEIIVAQAQLSLPQIESCSTLVMAYDVGGSTLLAVNNRKGEVLHITSDKAILDANLAENGSICYISSMSGYKSVLTVYNSNQECVYRWYSSQTYMPLCAISQEGSQLITIGMEQADGVFRSTLNFFTTNAEQIEKSVNLGSELIYDLKFLTEDSICTVGESDVQFFTSDGETAGAYSYQGSYLKDFDFDGDGFLTLSLNTYRTGNRYTLVTVDTSGQEIASMYIGQEILGLSACGKYVAVLTSEDLTIYNRSLELYAQTVDVGSASSVLMRKDGTALLLGDGTGELFVP